jgi:hypothetical protein
MSSMMRQMPRVFSPLLLLPVSSANAASVIAIQARNTEGELPKKIKYPVRQIIKPNKAVFLESTALRRKLQNTATRAK